jgi:hypothetical protein
MKKTILKTLVIAAAILSFTSCGDDDDEPTGHIYDDAEIFVKLQDAQGNVVNDSATIAKLVNYDPEWWNEIHDATAEEYSFKLIVKENGQWYYAVVLNESHNPVPTDNYTNQLEATLTAGKASYKLTESRYVKLGKNCTYHQTIGLKINGVAVKSDMSGKDGTYIHLTYK